MSTGVSNLNRVFTTVGSPVRWLGSGVESITGKNSVTEFLKSDLVTGAVGGLILGGNPITGAVGMSTGAAVGAGAALGQGYNEAKEASSQAEAAANQSAGATPASAGTLLTSVKSRKRVSNIFTSGQGLLGSAPITRKRLLGE